MLGLELTKRRFGLGIAFVFIYTSDVPVVVRLGASLEGHRRSRCKGRKQTRDIAVHFTEQNLTKKTPMRIRSWAHILCTVVRLAWPRCHLSSVLTTLRLLVHLCWAESVEQIGLRSSQIAGRLLKTTEDQKSHPDPHPYESP